MRGVYRRADRVFRPWKNGGGETAEIVAAPSGAGMDDFDWRLSTAIVAADGPFSTFPKVDRVLTVLEGGAMRLDLAGQSHLLDADSLPFAFAGDLPCQAALTAGPLLDFNVMTRRPLRAAVRRAPLTLAASGPAPFAHMALLLAPEAGLERLDLVDLRSCDAALAGRLVGHPVIEVVISA